MINEIPVPSLGFIEAGLAIASGTWKVHSSWREIPVGTVSGLLVATQYYLLINNVAYDRFVQGLAHVSWTHNLVLFDDDKYEEHWTPLGLAHYLRLDPFLRRGNPNVN